MSEYRGREGSADDDDQQDFLEGHRAEDDGMAEEASRQMADQRRGLDAPPEVEAGDDPPDIPPEEDNPEPADDGCPQTQKPEPAKTGPSAGSSRDAVTEQGDQELNSSIVREPEVLDEEDDGQHEQSEPEAQAAKANQPDEEGSEGQAAARTEGEKDSDSVASDTDSKDADDGNKAATAPDEAEQKVHGDDNTADSAETAGAAGDGNGDDDGNRHDTGDDDDEAHRDDGETGDEANGEDAADDGDERELSESARDKLEFLRGKPPSGVENEDGELVAIAFPSMPDGTGLGYTEIAVVETEGHTAARINGFSVDPEVQGFGLGTAMLLKLSEECQTRGMDTIDGYFYSAPAVGAVVNAFGEAVQIFDNQLDMNLMLPDEALVWLPREISDRSLYVRVNLEPPAES